ncbi:MAG: Fasciclin domain protein [Methanomethylovorans sp. PtaU1.Bin093]|uniref:fasciclin domain-containing protein n=2 Tax=Methanomethylovorans TaxID=101191 RepID=UPI0009D142F0|nr:fasciclin domain-containing protein [Methanomethylovorans sp. PtaU1.Bin093]OPY18098.1 MAG: Fasciclin domain protein [Methanomethylovorans sp. PtaU1.Bin093]
MKKWVIVILLIAFSLMLSGCTEQPEEQPEAGNESTVTEQKDIVQTAIDAGSFNTLVTAVQTADLVETLSGEGPFTVFAPTDDAFAAVPKETLNGLLANKTELTKVLTYHVASGKYMAEDVVSMGNITTLEGNMLDVEVTNEGVFVGGAKVIQTDIECSNGVIHVIDTVLIPPANMTS